MKVVLKSREVPVHIVHATPLVPCCAAEHHGQLPRSGPPRRGMHPAPDQRLDQRLRKPAGRRPIAAPLRRTDARYRDVRRGLVQPDGWNSRTSGCTRANANARIAAECDRRESDGRARARERPAVAARTARPMALCLQRLYGRFMHEAYFGVHLGTAVHGQVRSVLLALERFFRSSRLALQGPSWS